MQIVSKQLHSNKQENNRISDANTFGEIMLNYFTCKFRCILGEVGEYFF